jgi:hypothetical protein
VPDLIPRHTRSRNYFASFAPLQKSSLGCADRVSSDTVICASGSDAERICGLVGRVAEKQTSSRTFRPCRSTV